MLETVLDFFRDHGTIVASLLAVILSLRSYLLARKSWSLSLKSKFDADRIKLFEKRRELLSELDTQHARMGTLLMITAQKMILFNEFPQLQKRKPEEYTRLKTNLEAVQKLRTKYEEQRRGLEAIDVGADIARQEAVLADIRRLTIHIDEDILKEERDLEVLRENVRVATDA